MLNNFKKITKSTGEYKADSSTCTYKKKINLNRYDASDFSMNILGVSIKSPTQKGFFKYSREDLLPALRFLGELYNFCNFVIIFSLM